VRLAVSRQPSAASAVGDAASMSFSTAGAGLVEFGDVGAASAPVTLGDGALETQKTVLSSGCLGVLLAVSALGDTGTVYRYDDNLLGVSLTLSRVFDIPLGTTGIF
jgi:hypothetical protein